MTIPSERTRSLILAEQFLQDLRLRGDTPESIRKNAIGVLRHFPSVNEIKSEAEYQFHRQQDGIKQAWLLPMDYYDRLRKQELNLKNIIENGRE